jgi:hypothetical protein
MFIQRRIRQLEDQCNNNNCYAQPTIQPRFPAIQPRFPDATDENNRICGELINTVAALREDRTKYMNGSLHDGELHAKIGAAQQRVRELHNNVDGDCGISTIGSETAPVAKKNDTGQAVEFQLSEIVRPENRQVKDTCKPTDDNDKRCKQLATRLSRLRTAVRQARNTFETYTSRPSTQTKQEWLEDELYAARFFADYIDPYVADASPLYLTWDVTGADIARMRSAVNELAVGYNQHAKVAAARRRPGAKGGRNAELVALCNSLPAGSPRHSLVTDILALGTDIETLQDGPCSRVLPIPQFNGTCWFNAALMVVLYSQGTRTLAGSKILSWASDSFASDAMHTVRRWFLRLLMLHYTGASFDVPDEAYEMLSVITPSTIISKLFELDPYRFKFDVSLEEGWLSEGYIYHLLNHVMGIKTSIFRANRTTVNNTARYDLFKHDLSVTATLPDDVEVLLIDPVGGKSDSVAVVNSEPLVRGIVVSGPGSTGIIDVLGKSFRVDCITFEATNHEIAGITCNGQRFIYNGWANRTDDAAQTFVSDGSSTSSLGRPCPLFEFDWLTSIQGFCPDSKCSLKNISGRCYTTNISTELIVAVRSK